MGTPVRDVTCVIQFYHKTGTGVDVQPYPKMFLVL